MLLLLSKRKERVMSEKEMNSYRFTSVQEPSDEMLVQLMKEVAQEAKEKHQQATAAYLQQMRIDAKATKEKWADRIMDVMNGEIKS